MRQLNEHKKASIAVVLLLFLGLLPSFSNAQWLEPHRIKFGLSAGFGGLHEWGKPSFDIHWHHSTLRLAPGLFYLSAGWTQKLIYFKPKTKREKIVILSAYYHKDYFLSDRNTDGSKKDIHAIMIMPGLHYNLDHRGTFYMQVSAGFTYGFEKNWSVDGEQLLKKHHYLPMAEIRIGGVILSRKEHHQEFKEFKREVHKIKKKKIKYGKTKKDKKH